MIYTSKQLELMQLWQNNGLKRLNLLEGSVRSGKTWISLVLWAFWVGTMPIENQYLMCAKSLTTLKRNCLIPLEELIGSKNFKFSVSAKQGMLFGRTIYFEGANDARSEAKIRGMTLQGAYCDELTQFPEDFFAMLLSRLSLPGAKLIATTNPDNPHHWLKVNYIENPKLDFLDVKFLIDDNTTLDPEYVANIKREYVGVFHDRFILGLWKTAEGAIYKDFADNTEKYLLDTVPNDIIYAIIGMDFGGNGSAHAIICTGFSKGLQKVVILDEYYCKEVITPTQLENDVCDFIRRCQSKYKVYDMYCDSAEQVLIKGIKGSVVREHIPINVHNARKGVIIDRIRFTTSIMSQGRFYILRHCKHAIDAFQSAVWDSKQRDDIRLDNGDYNVDSLDAFEYSIESKIKDIMSVRVDKNANNRGGSDRI